jgi:tRNA-dihydrouridine synthase A
MPREKLLKGEDLRFSIAPMMDWTDRHCRAFHRCLTRRARLYTEMVTTAAVLHGDRGRLLDFDPVEHPVAVQLGGNSPEALAEVAAICAAWGYDEINLNVGCPSDRVQNGAFGACLMREPALVGQCVSAMKAAVRLPVTVKCRLGVDDQPREALDALADTVIAAGADALIVHARKAWLSGLSPRENRDIPPLDYARVFDLKRRYPNVPIALNGGLKDWAAIDAALQPQDGISLDGVMVGRAAYQDPALLLEVDARLYGLSDPVGSRLAAVETYLPYVAARLAEGVPLHAMTRHMLGLFNGLSGARLWRRSLSTEGVKPGAGLDVLREALGLVTPAALRGAA